MKILSIIQLSCLVIDCIFVALPHFISLDLFLFFNCHIFYFVFLWCTCKNIWFFKLLFVSFFFFLSSLGGGFTHVRYHVFSYILFLNWGICGIKVNITSRHLPHGDWVFKNGDEKKLATFPNFYFNKSTCFIFSLSFFNRHIHSEKNVRL